MSLTLDKPTLRQASSLLLASVVLGLASNALNPAGLRWGEANAESGLTSDEGVGRAGIYRNETLYENETLSATLMPRNAQLAAQTVPLAPGEFSHETTTPLRSTWAEVKLLLGSGRTVLVDARSRTAFDAGHIPGAVNLPFNSLQSEIQGFMTTYPPATPLAIYCANANCGTSSKLAVALAHTYKYSDVRYLPGGYQEWRTAEGK